MSTALETRTNDFGFIDSSPKYLTIPKRQPQTTFGYKENFFNGVTATQRTIC